MNIFIYNNLKFINENLILIQNINIIKEIKRNIDIKENL